MQPITTAEEIVATYKPGDMVYALQIWEWVNNKSADPVIRSVAIVSTHVTDSVLAQSLSSGLPLSPQMSMVTCCTLSNAETMEMKVKVIQVSANLTDLMPTYRELEKDILRWYGCIL